MSEGCFVFSCTALRSDKQWMSSDQFLLLLELFYRRKIMMRQEEDKEFLKFIRLVQLIDDAHSWSPFHSEVEYEVKCPKWIVSDSSEFAKWHFFPLRTSKPESRSVLQPAIASRTLPNLSHIHSSNKDLSPPFDALEMTYVSCTGFQLWRSSWNNKTDLFMLIHFCIALFCKRSLS